MDQETNYMKYRGKCKEMSEAECKLDPTLRLVRGHYHCLIWGEQQHWWAVKPDGTIVDPTVLQFPSKGFGEYIEFDGNIKCELCGAKTSEDDAIFHGHHAYCSDKCIMEDIM
jgi:hypothetical protein